MNQVKLTSKNIYNSRRKESYSGFKQPPKPEVLPLSVQKRLNKSDKITPDMYHEMLYFAQEQPSGKRKLNKYDVSKLVIGEDIAPLSNITGLREGGLVSEGNVDRKPLKNKTAQLSIKNNNRLKGSPDYPYFKNNFKLK